MKNSESLFQKVSLLTNLTSRRFHSFKDKSAKQQIDHDSLETISVEVLFVVRVGCECRVYGGSVERTSGGAKGVGAREEGRGHCLVEVGCVVRVGSEYGVYRYSVKGTIGRARGRWRAAGGMGNVPVGVGAKRA
jgi:hypothetical protein